MGETRSEKPASMVHRFYEALLGLQFRATCGVIALTLTMVAVICWLFVSVTGDLTGRLQRQKCAELAKVLAQAAAEPMTRGDKHALNSLAHQFIGSDSLVFVSFFDPSGKTVATADVDAARLRQTRAQGMTVSDANALGTPVFIRGRDGQPSYLEVIRPVNRLLRVDRTHPRAGHTPPRRMALLGYVCLGLNVEQSLRELSSAMDLVTGTAILVAIVTVPLGFFIVRHIVEPINELSEVTGEFAGGDLGVRSKVRRGDEIGRLAAAFNHMADLHQRNHNQLMALNAELEERVNRRTQQLRELASRDALTGLYNRRHFNEMLRRRLAEARRYQTPLSCLMLDLDDFKDTNDTHGHQVGDELLILTALTITSQLRAADVAARYGGDEFVVLLPQTTSQRARTLTERIAGKLDESVRKQLPDVKLTLSIGISSLHEVDSDDPDDLVRSADRALYRAKSEGKNRISAPAAAG